MLTENDIGNLAAELADINGLGRDLVSYYQVIVGSGRRVVWVNPVAGLDTNTGTQAQPLKTLKRAAELCPPGGFVTAILTGPITLLEDVPLYNQRMLIRSDGSTRHSIQFDRWASDENGVTFRRLRQFSLNQGSKLYIDGLTLVMPVADGVFAAMSAATGFAALVHSDWSPATGDIGLFIGGSHIQIPASNPYGAVFGAGQFSNPCDFYVISSTYTQGNGLGRNLTFVANTSGTASSSLPWLRTNLETI
jgi:hypothetical protein